MSTAVPPPVPIGTTTPPLLGVDAPGTRESLLKARRSYSVAQYLTSDGGVTPLEVLVTCMRRAYDEQDFDQAVTLANLAAPYMHPKLSAVQAHVHTTSDQGLDLMTKAISALSTDELRVLEALHQKMGLTIDHAE